MATFFNPNEYKLRYLQNKHKQKWFAQLPIYNIDELGQAILVLTEYIEVHAGIIKTAEWECSDKYIDYGYYTLVVTYERYV